MIDFIIKYFSFAFINVLQFCIHISFDSKTINHRSHILGFILLLIGVVVVLLFLGRTGRLQPAKARMTQGIRTIRNTIRVRSHTNGGYNVCNAYIYKY